MVTISTDGKGASVRGFKGSGTEDDPLLVESGGHFQRMFDANVGRKGYYFRQTADFDLAGDGWKGPEFVGHYDGAGHGISSNGTDSAPFLLQSISKKSSVKRLHVSNFRLVHDLEGEICDCRIEAISVGSSGVIFESNHGDVRNVYASANNIRYVVRGGDGQIDSSFFESRIFDDFGIIIARMPGVNPLLKIPVANNSVDQKSNNCLAAGFKVEADGWRTVSDAQVNRELFENGLGWDFGNIWDWDATSNTPVLRVDDAPVRASQQETIADDDAQQALHEKLKNNIWI